MFMPKGPFCQSCGMPLSKDEKGGGINADGSKSTEYCSRCYQDGKFINPDMTVEQMMELVKGKLKQMHMPWFIVNAATREIPKLKRWQSGI